MVKCVECGGSIGLFAQHRSFCTNECRDKWRQAHPLWNKPLWNEQRNETRLLILRIKTWKCEYCNMDNNVAKEHCENCGSPRRI